jgi:hypothetical protein
MNTHGSLVIVACVMAGSGLMALPGCSDPAGDPKPEVRSPSGAGDPTGVTFHWETLQRKGKRGDNWCMTWAADDNLYTMMDDGIGWNEDGVEWGTKFLQISGDESFDGSNVKEVEGWPFTPLPNPFYGYGTYSVDGRIYVWLFKSEVDRFYSRPIANRLLYTDDHGQSFHRWDGTEVTAANFSDTHPESFFFYKEDPRLKYGDRYAYAFNWIAFCQNGRDNSAARDDYVYMYAVEQYDVTRLSLIRVHKKKVTDRSAYEYLKELDGETPVWTSDMTERGATVTYPARNDNGEEWHWSSWFPSVVYNPGLDRYILVSYGISDENKEYFAGWCDHCTRSSTVGMWHSRNPWGPWKRFYYQAEWKTPGDPPAEWGFDGDASRTYQFKLNPKWIYDDGRTMYLIWSDAGGRWDDDHFGHSSYWYRWNQVKITLSLEEDE